MWKVAGGSERHSYFVIFLPVQLLKFYPTLPTSATLSTTSTVIISFPLFLHHLRLLKDGFTLDSWFLQVQKLRILQREIIPRLELVQWLLNWTSSRCNTCCLSA